MESVGEITTGYARQRRHGKFFQKNQLTCMHSTGVILTWPVLIQPHGRRDVELSDNGDSIVYANINSQQDARPGELYEVMRNFIRCTEPVHVFFGCFMTTTWAKLIRSNHYIPPTLFRVLDEMDVSVSRTVKVRCFWLSSRKKSIHQVKKKKNVEFP